MHIDGLLRAQEGVIARRQLNELGVDSDRVRNQLHAGRWRERTATVLSSTTGELTRAQLRWVGVLHHRVDGGDGLLAGIDALQLAGLERWERPDVEVVVPYESGRPEPVAGIVFHRSRRDLSRWIRHRDGLPCLGVEAAALFFAATCRGEREAQGLVAAVVQQRLTTPERLSEVLSQMPRLRRAPLLRRLLLEIADGAQSLAEVEVASMCDAFGLARPQRQVRRRDSAGANRFTDCEWRLPDGRVIVLEVDGGFHRHIDHWEDDLRRQRRLTSPGVQIVRCTSRELRDEPHLVAADLRALGVPPADSRVA